VKSELIDTHGSIATFPCAMKRTSVQRFVNGNDELTQAEVIEKIHTLVCASISEYEFQLISYCLMFELS